MDGDRRASHPQVLMDLFQGGVGMLADVVLKLSQWLALKTPWLTDLAFAGSNSSRQQPLPLELVDPPFPDFETLGDLSDRPLVLIVDFHHPFPQIHGIGFHSLHPGIF